MRKYKSAFCREIETDNPEEKKIKKYDMINKKMFLFILFNLCFISGYSMESNPLPLRQIDSLLNIAVSMDIISGNVLIEHDRKIVYEKSFGKADYEKNIPNTAETKFQLASITKDFTRVMILELSEQKKLNLNDNIGKYLSGFSGEVNKVNIYQLMDFTSGLGDYHQSPDFRKRGGRALTIPDIIPIIQKEKLQFEPGSQFLYSNSGYVVLGAIIEKVTGKSYYLNLRELILDKLNMKNTGINGYIEPLPGIAVGYLTNQIVTLQNNSDWKLSGSGDGGMYTTTRDMLTFINSVFYDNILLADSDKLKYVSVKISNAKLKSWDDIKESCKYSPAGGAPGVSTFFAVDMATKNIAIIFSNYDEGTSEEIGTRITALLNNKPVEELKKPASKYLYNIIKTKGGRYFEENYKLEFENSGMRQDDDMVLLNVGEGLLQERDYDDAVSLYKVYTKEFPEIIIAWNDLGDAYLGKGDKVNANESFSQALKLRPENERAKEGLKKLE